LSPFQLGATYYRNSGNNGDLFNGTIDDVAVYNRALSATEVQLHYDSGRQ
jgi:Concanavalin A-like lectin/glucanases superfamily